MRSLAQMRSPCTVAWRVADSSAWRGRFDPESRFSRLIAGAARVTPQVIRDDSQAFESKPRARARQGFARIGRRLGQGNGWARLVGLSLALLV